jgi:hypothetical protein
MLHDFSNELKLNGRNCIGLWLQGLLGDTILASTYFRELISKYPNKKWIIVHSYKEKNKTQVVLDLLLPYFDNGQIKEYVYHFLPRCLPMPREVVDLFVRCGVDDVEELSFAGFDKSKLTEPALGFNFDKPKLNKVILMRQSTWNPHFLERNRPYEEWHEIEKTLLEAHRIPHFIGIEDTMPIIAGIDLRNRLSIRGVLEHSSDASLCISCTTFLPVFTQFVCPTLVICDPADYDNQMTNWKLTENYKVFPAEENYLNQILENI